MQHLSPCQPENKLPIEMLTWHTECNKFKMSRLLQILLFSFSQAENINIRSPQLNSNFGQRWLSSGFLTAAMDRTYGRSNPGVFINPIQWKMPTGWSSGFRCSAACSWCRVQLKNNLIHSSAAVLVTTGWIWEIQLLTYQPHKQQLYTQ